MAIQTDEEAELQRINDQWMGYIELGLEKKKEFDRVAALGLRFYDSDHRFVFEKIEKELDHGHFRANNAPSDEDGDSQQIMATVNRVFELVSIFGPMMYNKNPNFLVTPSEKPQIDPAMWPDDPFIQQLIEIDKQRANSVDRGICAVIQTMLNYVARESGLRYVARMAVVEGLIKGLGVIGCEVWEPPGRGGIKLVRPRWIRCDHIVFDPDATCPEEAQWIGKLCSEPTRHTERAYGYEYGELEGQFRSSMGEANIKGDTSAKRLSEIGKPLSGDTHNVTQYWKIYSKVGLGRPKDRNKNTGQADNAKDGMMLEEMFGDNVFLAVGKGFKHPLNLPPKMLKLNPLNKSEVDKAKSALSWQVPHWADNGWPFVFLQFHRSPNKLYPLSHIKPALGEQFYIDWGYSMLYTRLRTSHQTRIIVDPGLPQKFEADLRCGADWKVLRGLKGMDISKMIQIVQMPPVQPDAWRTMDKAELNFDKRVGLLPPMYGAQGERQVRSGTEAKGMYDQLNVRPADMRDQVEEMLSELGRRMTLTMWAVTSGRDAQHVIGLAGAYVWDKYFKTRDLGTIVGEYDNRIEAGSMNKPNYGSMLETMAIAAQFLLPALKELSAVPGPAGKANMEQLNNFLNTWYKAQGLDYRWELVHPGIPPMAPQPPGMPGQMPMDPAAAGQPPMGPPPGPPMPMAPPMDPAMMPPELPLAAPEAAGPMAGGAALSPDDILDMLMAQLAAQGQDPAAVIDPMMS